MEERVLGRTERPVSVIGLGTWQLGADWGEVSETAALEVLSAAVESGVTFSTQPMSTVTVAASDSSGVS